MRRSATNLREWLRAMFGTVAPLAERAKDMIKRARSRFAQAISASPFPTYKSRIVREVSYTERTELFGICIETSQRRFVSYEECTEYLSCKIQYTAVQEDSQEKRVELPALNVAFFERRIVRRIQRGYRDRRARAPLREEATE